MADTKISALPAATTPLAGTEVLPIVQGGVTDKVAVNDLTVRNLRANATTGILQVTGPVAGSTRVMTAPDANFTVARTDAAQSFTGNQTLSTGNLVIGTSGQGIDFSATPGTGTSELLTDYEEGTWTPSYTTTGGNFTTHNYITQIGTYTRIGRMVYIYIQLRSTTYTGGSGDLEIAGLPFTTSSNGDATIPVTFAFGWAATPAVVAGTVASSTRLTLNRSLVNQACPINSLINDGNSNFFRLAGCYQVA